MKPAPFDLHRPTSVNEAVDMLASLGDEAKILAGGQSLVPMLSLRLVSPAHLVDCGCISELRRIERVDGEVRIGTMVTHEVLGRDQEVASAAPLLARAVPFVGHAAIRNRGTFGGSLAHADPAAELPAVCLALRASMEIAGPRGTRQVSSDDFFVSMFTTSLESDEVLRAVHVPVREARCGFGIEEIARRRGDFALAGAACSVRLGADGRVLEAGVGLFGVTDRPWRSSGAERAMVGLAGDTELDDIAEVAVDGLEPVDTVHASGVYRRRAARVMVARALGKALQEARHE